MKPFNPGGHSAYQNRVLDGLRRYYPDAVSSLPASTCEIMEKFRNLDLSGFPLAIFQVSVLFMTSKSHLWLSGKDKPFRSGAPAKGETPKTR